MRVGRGCRVCVHVAVKNSRCYTHCNFVRTSSKCTDIGKPFVYSWAWPSCYTRNAEEVSAWGWHVNFTCVSNMVAA